MRLRRNNAKNMSKYKLASDAYMMEGTINRVNREANELNLRNVGSHRTLQAMLLTEELAWGESSIIQQRRADLSEKIIVLINLRCTFFSYLNDQLLTSLYSQTTMSQVEMLEELNVDSKG